VAEWLDAERYQAFAGQRSRIETAKLLATFSAGMAAAVVATALQVGDPNVLDGIAVVFLSLAFAGAIAAILLDRTKDVDVDAVVRDAHVGGWTHIQLINALRQASYTALTYNRSVVNSTRLSALYAASAAFASGALATLSLLQPSA
jgi:hypothetical protein